MQLGFCLGSHNPTGLFARPLPAAQSVRVVVHRVKSWSQHFLSSTSTRGVPGTKTSLRIHVLTYSRGYAICYNSSPMQTWECPSHLSSISTCPQAGSMSWLGVAFASANAQFLTMITSYSQTMVATVQKKR